MSSNHEAVCTKANGTRWHGISFGSHSKWAHRAKRNCRLALQHGLADECTALSLDDLPERFRLGPDGTNRTVLSTPGIGWWKWKPWLLAHHMEHRMAVGDVLLWFDNDAPLGARSLAPLFCIGQNAVSGVVPFHQSCFLDGQFSNRRLTEALNATSAELSTAQVWAGLLVLRKEEAVVRFLSEWSSWAPLFENDPTSEKGHPLNRETPDFIVHRHDQSCLSLLAKRHRIKTYPVPISSHDPADMWLWDAGLCQVNAPLDTSYYAPYYGPLEAVEKLCQLHTHQAALRESYFLPLSERNDLADYATTPTAATAMTVAQPDVASRSRTMTEARNQSRSEATWRHCRSNPNLTMIATTHRNASAGAVSTRVVGRGRIFFVHLHKAAGTSTCKLASTRMRVSRTHPNCNSYFGVECLPHASFCASLASYCDDHNQDFVAWEIPYSSLPLVPEVHLRCPGFYYGTVYRHPIIRLASWFRASASGPGANSSSADDAPALHTLRAACHDEAAFRRLTASQQDSVDNAWTRGLTGRTAAAEGSGRARQGGIATAFGQVGRQHAQQAFDLLTQVFTVVADADTLVSDSFVGWGWTNVTVPRLNAQRNVGGTITRYDPLSTEDVRCLSRLNVHDLWLYASLKQRESDAAASGCQLLELQSRLSPCIAGQTFGCNSAEASSKNMWVSQGCRGLFLCHGVPVTCGRAGDRAPRRVCDCTGERKR